jgi:tRNA (guanine37-N1)-methyltransferase
MHIDILTIFPDMFVGPFAESMLKRAQDKGIATIAIHDLRNWSTDSHRSVDDHPYGGGAGMVMRVDLVDRALTELKKENENCKIVLLSAKGQAFTQQKAQSYSHLDQLILICGHYEGVDERVAEQLVDEEIRIGDYVLTGGELPAMVISDAVVRLLPGVLGNEESLTQESHSEPGYLEYPHYTRPEEYKGWKVPDVLLSGNHAEIAKWRKKQTDK